MQVRIALGEDREEFLQSVQDRYAQMEEEGLFDAILDTSSSKLATAALLHSLGVESNFMEFPQPP